MPYTTGGRGVGGLRRLVARRGGGAFDRVAEALVEPKVAAACRERPGESSPSRSRLPLQIGVSEESVDRHGREAFRRVEDQDRYVAREQRRE